MGQRATSHWRTWCVWKFNVAGLTNHEATPVGFEPTRGDPIGLAGRRLNHSAKVSNGACNCSKGRPTTDARGILPVGCHMVGRLPNQARVRFIFVWGLSKCCQLGVPLVVSDENRIGSANCLPTE